MTDASISFMDTPPRIPVRIAVTGILGYGAVHLRALSPLLQTGAVTLAAVADRRPRSDLPGLAERLDARAEEALTGAAYFTDVEQMLAQVDLDVVVLATPIATHAPLAAAAMRAGAHVLVEKPPTATFASFTELLAVTRETGRACQVGFQTFGSDVFDRIEAIVAAGEIGQVEGIGAVGTWLRARSYYERAPWAGRRTLDGEPVVDGVVTNPLAHAVATALRIDGSTRAEDVAALEVELFRAHDIEADDTSSVRIITARGTHIGIGLTLCAPAQSPPRILISGSRGRIELSYTEDRLTITSPAGERIEQGGRVSLLENLLDHARDPAMPLLSPLAASGAFMRVLEAVRTAPDPAPIPAQFIDWREGEAGTHPVVTDVEQWCERVATDRRTFTTLGAPWAPRARTLARLHAGESIVADFVDGAAMSALDSPRPHLHPVRTRGGIVVTDTAPADHTWHAGVGVAVQDVSGANLWGGRTYVREQGYTWLTDHGTMELRRWLQREPQALSAELVWRGPAGQVLAEETRTMRAHLLTPSAWVLELTFAVQGLLPGPLTLGSPGSNGRPGGGYGGFFWRLPPCTDIDVRTEAARTEEAVHGTRAPWLAWSAQTPDGPFTIVLAQEADPWFVRAAGYPGIGAALAWDTPVTLAPGETLHRSVRAIVADGRLADEQIGDLLTRAARPGAAG